MDTESNEQHNEYDSVVVGLCPKMFDYAHMNLAFRALKQPNVPLIAIHKGKYFETGNGHSLGPGPFVSALEYASGKEAIVIGKPTRSFFQLVLDDLYFILHP